MRKFAENIKAKIESIGNKIKKALDIIAQIAFIGIILFHELSK